jgi:hypothetical protein
MIKHTIAALALTLSLASSAVQAQETNCDGWLAREWELVKQFWETATPETVADCLNSGSSVSARSRFGIAPVHFASEISENPEVITVLLDNGSDGTAVDKDGKTPFDLAKENEALAGTDAYWALNDAQYK